MWKTSMQFDFNLEFGIQKYEISVGNPKASDTWQ